MHTIELCRENAYRRECEAEVLAVTAAGDGVCAIRVDQSVFYPEGGGQPGDSGILTRADGREIGILDTRKQDGALLHLSNAPEPPAAGERVSMAIDWERRHRLMRMHSCMHMLCAVIPAAVTGGSIRDGSARIDFNLPTPPDKQELEAELNRLIAEDHPMRLRWISDAEMAAQPELVRTMSVRPPSGEGRVRLVEFEGADLQPCGGTHVASSGEIGAVRVQSIKSKGKQNRRVTVVFA
ncbi:MAG: alanyl-tRNA editing protein [Gammaproteobacteria bacterium]